MTRLYDGDKIANCFENSPRWADEHDEIVRMHMSYKGHAVMMGKIIEAVMDAVEDSFGAVSILDVGCGTGMLLNYMRERNALHRIERYTGFELVSDFADKTSQKILDWGVRGSVHHGDFFKTFVNPHDVVVATQSLNTIFSEDKYAFIEEAIGRMWALAEKAVVFDLKDISAPTKYPDREYYDPLEIHAICRKLTSNVKIEQVTKANFTVTLFKKELF